uniref:Uncharacterized protein n=1 Tax=Panagrolaimus sp. ES5 TaxID=591445 RepID=A0AC34GQZ7_9BILA
MNFLHIFIGCLFLCGLVFCDSAENDDQISSSNESNDEIIYVCNNEAKNLFCKCENETLKCIHELIDGEILDSANLGIKQESFLLKNVELNDNAITVLKKGFIFPKNIKTIVILNFGNNHISEIENEAFDSFNSLEELDLNSNTITEIDKKVFTKKLGATLLRLKLDKNKIQELTSNSFKYLTELVYLDLSRNKKLEVDLGIFSKSLAKLETLKMGSCDIEELDDDTFYNLKNLKTLVLEGNPLTTIPAAIVNIPHLIDLDLGDTEISDINTNAFSANNNLTSLSLRFMTKLFVVDDCAFCGLPNLEKLYLYSNKNLKTIDENAFGAVKGERALRKLKSLVLKGCRLTTLPEKLYDWKMLEILSVNGNRFVCDCSMAWLINNPKIYAKASVPVCSSPPSLNGTHFTSIAGTFCGGEGAPKKNKSKIDKNASSMERKNELKNQEILIHSKNRKYSSQIDGEEDNEEDLDDNFEQNAKESNEEKQLIYGFIMPDNAEKVTRLQISYNFITDIENNAFDVFHELETLEMRSNLLTDIDDHVLTKKLGKTLQTLYLDHNKFEIISSNAFIHLHNLKELHVSSNPIKKFRKETFPEALANLKFLHLGSCNIKTLDDDVFENLKSLRDLILFNNPLTSVPKALNGIPNLFALDLSDTLIETLNTNTFDEDSNLSQISFFSMHNLISIDNCAFCGLSNLTWIGFWYCEKLSFIHENAFGAVTNKKIPQIESFVLSDTNITVLPEKLLNWEAVKEISISGNNHMACNCSNAWLINDISLYKMFSFYVPKCASPPELVNKSFTTVSGTICLDTIPLNSDDTFWSIILFVAVILAIIAFFCYTRYARRVQKIGVPDLSQMTYRNLSAQQNLDDEEELQAHF